MSSSETNPYQTPETLVNHLPVSVDYRIQETEWGTWRSFMYENGKTYQEFTSFAKWGELPLVHYTAGKFPETGRAKTARGVIAIGRFARGYMAFGQVAIGYIAVGQLSVGIVSIGQLAIGMMAIGQAAISIFHGLGQFAIGYYAVGQFAVGRFVTGMWTYQLPLW